MPSPLQVLIFPFMSKGHTIPLLHLARLLLCHRPNTTVTIFTTPANKSFMSDFFSDLSTFSSNISFIILPFPHNIPGVPIGVESTDQLPSISLFLPFVTSTKDLQRHFESALQNLLHYPQNETRTTFLISDAFLYWTLHSASKFNIPRLVFHGMSGHATTLLALVSRFALLSGPDSDDEPITVPDFPWIKLRRNDFDHPLNMRKPKGPYLDFLREMEAASDMSYGMVVNSFYELEPKFLDFWNTKLRPKALCMGPFCMVEKPKTEAQEKPNWIAWLDQKSAQEKNVLYVAFGTQADLSNEQIREIVTGLEKSQVEFLWVVRGKEEEREEGIIDGFEERVVKREGRGLVVREWVGQREILGHKSVKGFLSHCGWNSVMESICAKVPILAWPMMAEQHLNARMVVEEMKVGLRVETMNGSVKGLVGWEGLEKMVRELMEGEKGKEVREKVKEVGEMASKAVEEGGSSWHTVELFLHALQTQEANQVKNL